MGRKLWISRTESFGHFMIPYEERLTVELCQSIIHHAYHRMRFPEFVCRTLERDMKSEVYELFVEHDGVSRIPKDHFDTLLNMGVGYMVEFEEALEYFRARTEDEPILLPISKNWIDRVALVV